MKLISVNIEGQKHLERIRSFLISEKPDVVCLQEVYECDLPAIAELFSMQYHFAPHHSGRVINSDKGIAILAPEFQLVTSKHFAGRELASQKVNPEENCESQYHHNTIQLITSEIMYEGHVFRFNTTHLPVTREGEVAWFQLEAVDRLMIELKQQPELILCGDTNAPRGREAFAKMAAEYKDNIPTEYTSSIDGDLHQAGPIEFVVDALFTTPGYQADNVRYVSGVSDHCAIVADISVVK